MLLLAPQVLLLAPQMLMMKNQRFEFPAGGGSGQIQAWAGWAKGYCVAAVVPPAKPWYIWIPPAACVWIPEVNPCG